MKRILLTLLGLTLGMTTFVRETLGIGINDFKQDVYRPGNLPTTATAPGGVEVRISEILQYAINLILYASGSVAVVFLVIGGIRYITSLGNQEAMDAAKKIVKYALIGLIAVILSYAAVFNVIDLIYKATA